MLLKPSKYLFLLITALYLGAVICVGIILIPWYFKTLIIAFVCTHYYLICRQHLLLLNDNAIVKLIWLEGQEWKLITKDRSITYANLQGNSFLSGHLAILNFKSQDVKHKSSVVICSDSLLQQDFRLLKMQILTC